MIPGSRLCIECLSISLPPFFGLFVYLGSVFFLVPLPALLTFLFVFQTPLLVQRGLPFFIFRFHIPFSLAFLSFFFLLLAQVLPQFTAQYGHDELMSLCNNFLGSRVLPRNDGAIQNWFFQTCFILLVQYLTLQKKAAIGSFLSFKGMDLQVPSLAVLSAENATLNDQLQWLYDFPFAALIRRPIFQTALNDILKSLTPNQLLEYMDDRPYNPAMTDRIVKEMFRRFSLDTLELISRSFHVDHPFAKAMDFAIHKERMSGTITLLNRWSIRLFPPPCSKWVIRLDCKQCDISIEYRLFSTS